VTLPGSVHKFDVVKIDKSLIVDTNGAGDAFSGGFIGQLLTSSDISKCVASGSYTAS